MAVASNLSLAAGQTGIATVTVSGSFPQQDSVTLTAAGPGGVTIGAMAVQNWDNNTGGVFVFPITGQTVGAFTLNAVENSFGMTGSSSNNVVTGVTSFSVDN